MFLEDDARHFQISAPIQPGNSGGALVDERGNVIGVVVAQLLCPNGAAEYSPGLRAALPWETSPKHLSALKGQRNRDSRGPACAPSGHKFSCSSYPG